MDNEVKSTHLKLRIRVMVIRLTNQGTGKKISLPEMNARILDEDELLKKWDKEKSKWS